MSEADEPELDPNDAAQRRVLLQVLVLNAGLAVGLLVAGLWADSSALTANALDNFSDAVTYGVSFFAVTRSQRAKSIAAGISGVMLLVLAVGVTIDAVRRFISGSEPIGVTMIAMAIIAVIINAVCVKLLRKFRRSDVNLRAAWTMSINDFASNFGIVIAGGLVAWLGSNWPDLALGLVIAGVASYGGIKTLRDAYRERKGNSGAPAKRVSK
jgi:cobalt-zinc-cadmium efflux system protein